MLSIIDQAHYDKVVEFAKKTNQLEKLQKELDILATYASRDDDNTRTRCDLYQDVAPYSFYFWMHRKQEVRDWECYCGNKYTVPVEHGDTPNISGEKTAWCLNCSKKPLVSSPIRAEYKKWFNGGLIYHGPHDNGGRR